MPGKVQHNPVIARLRRGLRAARQKASETRFPASLFWLVFGILLLLAGVQIGLILLLQALRLSPIVQTHILLFYWVAVSVLVVLFIRRKVYAIYDVPLQKVSRAIERVSAGDFSVRIPVTHPPEQFDYVDMMITDMNAMIGELGGIETLRTDFIANVSHELKTPLTVMQNYATMLQSPALDEETRMQYAKAVSSNCRRLTALVTNILRLNKLENQQIYPKVAPYDVGEQLRECILGFEDAWEQQQIAMHADIADGILLDTDGELLSLVWNNLLSNALKFTPPGGAVFVTLVQCGQMATVTVRDTGAGMDAQTQKHIFEKFYQGDTSHASQGNGLGLALAWRVVTIAGGSIRVQSAPGQGSTFTVQVPVHMPSRA